MTRRKEYDEEQNDSMDKREIFLSFGEACHTGYKLCYSSHRKRERCDSNFRVVRIHPEVTFGDQIEEEKEREKEIVIWNER